MEKILDFLIDDFYITYFQMQCVTRQDKPDMHKWSASVILGEDRNLYNMKERVQSNYFNIIKDDEETEFAMPKSLDFEKLLQEYEGTNYQMYLGQSRCPSTHFYGEKDDRFDKELIMTLWNKNKLSEGD